MQFEREKFKIGDIVKQMPKEDPGDFSRYYLITGYGTYLGGKTGRAIVVYKSLGKGTTFAQDISKFMGKTKNSNGEIVYKFEKVTDMWEVVSYRTDNTTIADAQKTELLERIYKAAIKLMDGE